MNTIRKNTMIAGVSIASICSLLLHLAHLYGSLNSHSENPYQEKIWQNAPVTIIEKDSSGKPDTMKLEEYVEKHQHKSIWVPK